MTSPTQRVVLLTARDPLRAGDGAHPLRLATELAGAGHQAVLALLEDAVVMARAGHAVAPEVVTAVSKGVRVLAEDEALARRGIAALADGVEPASMGEVLELLLTGSDRQAWV